jgi:hypothetical protein
MMITRLVAAVTLVLAAVTVAPAQADGPQRGVYGLSIDPHLAPTRSVTLKCVPDGGTHPHVAQACAQLAKVSGVIGRIPPTDRLCPQIWKPVTVRVSGWWAFQWRGYAKNYPNLCMAIADTGGYIFDF